MYAHMLLLGIDSDHSSHTSGNASDDASDDISTGSDMSFVGDLCIALLALSFRAERLVVMRMNWVTLQLVFLTLPLFVPRNIHSSPKKVSSCVESGLSIVESIALLVHAKRALRLGFFGSHTPVSGIA